MRTKRPFRVRTALAAIAFSLVMAGCNRFPSLGGQHAAESPSRSTPTAGGADVARGARIFGQQCAACHQADGSGIGPSLKGERRRKGTARAIAWIENPQPPMPKLYPSPLGQKDVADVAAYVESL